LPWTGPTHARAGAIAAPSEPRASSPAVPSEACIPPLLTQPWSLPERRPKTSVTTGAREHQRQGWSRRSALGPYRIGHVGIPAGASGDHEHKGTAGHRVCTPRTSAAGARRKRLRIPPDGCRGPAALANEAGVTEDGPHPAAEVVPSPAGPSMFILNGRAPAVPYASVDSGHSRTTRVGPRSLRAVGTLHTERSEGASKLAVRRWLHPTHRT
jgi:hypothetical protein